MDLCRDVMMTVCVKVLNRIFFWPTLGILEKGRYSGWLLHPAFTHKNVQMLFVQYVKEHKHI